MHQDLFLKALIKKEDRRKLQNLNLHAILKENFKEKLVLMMVLEQKEDINLLSLG